jgi:hypothetical protein
MPRLWDQYAMGTPHISIRLAETADLAALQRVAERDSRLLPGGRLLLAEVAGEVRAALSLDTGDAVADPFRPTAELVELLRIRARHQPGRPSGTRGRVGKLALRSAET